MSSDRDEARAAVARTRHAWLPPRWFIVTFWHGHRALVRATGGRVGLWRPKPGGWGTLRLTTTGRRSGMPRQIVVIGCPDATVQTRDGARHVRGRRALGEERERLWSRWAEIDRNLDDYAARRPTETAVVVLEAPDAAEPSA